MKDLHIDTGIFIQEPAEEYHAKASENLSSHQLLDFMKCPYLHQKKRAGLIQQKESVSLQVLSIFFLRSAKLSIFRSRPIFKAWT